MLSLSGALSVGLLAGSLTKLKGADTSSRKTKKVLFFTKSANYEHSVIKHEGGKPSLAETVLTEIGGRNGLEFTFSKDGSLFSPEYFAGFDLLFFYTTGDLGQPGTDGQPPVTLAGKQALLDAVAAGKGFMGCHSASDTYHTNELGNKLPSGNAGRYHNYGKEADPFVRMLGGEFIKHGAQQKSRLIAGDPKFPGAAGLAGAELHEEWYSLKDFSPDLHVIYVQDTAGMEGPVYQRKPYPCTWARMHGKGRVFYTSLGHRDDVWTNPKFQDLLGGAMKWSLGLVEADVSPNLEKVAPGYADIPPQDPPQKSG